MSELDTLAQWMKDVDDYTDVFQQQDTIKSDYIKLAQVLHPDNYGVQDHVDLATEAFHRLSVFKAEAVQMAREGRFGQRQVMATITTRKARHQITGLYGEGDLAKLYKASTQTDNGAEASLIKVAKSPADNDLLAQEARALKKLFAEDHQLVRHYPALLDTFVHSEGRRRSNALGYLDGHYTLEQVRSMFPTGVDPGHGVWMFRRLLMALGYAHDNGLVHGAVVPKHVMIEPHDHGVVLIDWCYSQVIDDKSKTNFIKAVVPMYTNWYPEEVTNKEAPSAATDLFMAAHLMNYLIPVAPKPFRAFFKGTALTKRAARPQNAWLLLEEFDALLKSIGEPFYPKRFVKFVVPSGAA